MNPIFAEFFGTMLLIILGDGVVAGVLLKGSKSENAGWLTVVVGWGIAVMIAIFTVGKFSGAHLNPAVTVAFAFAGSFPWPDVLPYILAQVGGAIVGAAIVWIHFLPHWKRTDDQSTKLAVFCTAPAIRSTISNIVSEVIATAILVFTLFLLGTHEFAQGFKPIVVGLLIVCIGLSLGGTTGFAINPARDLGPRIAHAILPIHGKGGSDWGYAWIPVVGPLLGGLAGAIVFQAFFQ